MELEQLLEEEAADEEEVAAEDLTVLAVAGTLDLVRLDADVAGTLDLDRLDADVTGTLDLGRLVAVVTDLADVTLDLVRVILGRSGLSIFILF